MMTMISLTFENYGGIVAGQVKIRRRSTATPFRAVRRYSYARIPSGESVAGCEESVRPSGHSYECTCTTRHMKGLQALSVVFQNAHVGELDMTTEHHRTVKRVAVGRSVIPDSPSLSETLLVLDAFEARQLARLRALIAAVMCARGCGNE